MQAQAACGVALGAVLLIPDHGATDMGQLDPDLVAATGFQGEFDQGSLQACFKNPVVGDGMSGLTRSGPNRDMMRIGLVQI